MYTDLVCRGIHPARLLLKISITLTLLKLSGDLKTLGVTTMRLFTCHRQALDRTRTRLILRYDFSGHQVSRDTCYRRKATLESHMRRFMIKRTRKRHKQRKRHVWRLLMNGIREMGRGGGIERVQRHCCKNSRLFQNMKYSMAVIKALNNISFKSVRMRAWKV